MIHFPREGFIECSPRELEFVTKVLGYNIEKDNLGLFNSKLKRVCQERLNKMFKEDKINDRR